MHRGPYATSYWPAKANQVGGPPGPDSRLAMAPQNAKCFGISVPSLDLCVCTVPANDPYNLITPSRDSECHTRHAWFGGLAAWLSGGLAAPLLRCCFAGGLAAYLSHTPVELHMPRRVTALGVGVGELECC